MTHGTTKPTSRRGRRARLADADGTARSGDVHRVVPLGSRGGAFNPLSDHEVGEVHAAVLDVLATIGLGDAPHSIAEPICACGGSITEAGRLLFPATLVEEIIAKAARPVTLHGRTDLHTLELSPGRVYCGPGGAAPEMLDHRTQAFRPARLQDVYEAARVVDALEHTHFFVRPVVARDIEDPMRMDIATAYAALTGTTKPVFVSAAAPEHVDAIATLCAETVGGADVFRGAPFLALNINHVVPPLRFDPHSCAVMIAALRHGIPMQINAFDQAGASSPASLAGSLVQSLAECLAGLVVAHCIDDRAVGIIGPRTLVADLRTGALTGGSGEQAIATAAAAQMCRHYGLANSCIAGGTDAKLPDAQSGYEKAHAVALAAHAGCNLITQACGVQASLMACALESYVIDNDMLGCILRGVRGMEISRETLAQEVIATAVGGDNHFLAASDTYRRMKTDYLYPDIADRRSIAEWQDAGAPDIRTTATRRVEDILAAAQQPYIDAAVDARLRARFDLPQLF
ncbi:MAG: trimethylamine methyltransferase family protein [Pseudomonadota bacterium]